MYSRAGRELPLLSSILLQLPQIFVDGEIWFGRGLYSHTYTFYNGAIEFVHWDLLKLIGFDDPSINERMNYFEKRYENLSRIAFNHPTLVIAFRVKCKNDGHMNYYLSQVIDFGGEGIILRKCTSLYEKGRTSSLIKLKTAYGDQEGIVIAKEDDQSITVKHPSGVTFKVPATNIHLSKTLKIGDIVSFTSERMARRESPANPHVFRVREDLEWEDVIFNHFNEKKPLAEHLQLSGFTSQPIRHWTMKNMRLFLENFAKSRNLDPLLPETWYSLPYQYISHLKSGDSILRKFKGHINALQQLFPDVNFDINSFPRGSWSDVTNRRKFFENYASNNQFDSLIPENWYFQPTDRIMAVKGATSLLYHHNGSLSQALMDLFPNIGLDNSKLWISPRDRKRFFEQYAKVKGFNPLIPENWYSQSKSNIMAEGRFVIDNYYNGRASKALMELFPNIGLDKAKFWPKPIWQEARNRKIWFENFAKEYNFDPLLANNWYDQPRDRLLSFHGLSGVLNYHNQSITQALLDLFPNIGLEKSKMWKKREWEDDLKRRDFFERIATDIGFNYNDSNGWYSQSMEKLKAIKGISGVISYHRNSIPQALMDLFPDIGIKKSGFSSQSSFAEIRKRRQFFETIAKDNHFDPLIADNWYNVPLSSILAIKGVNKVLSYHRNNVPQALLDLFPTIGLDKRRFSSSSSSFEWKTVENRKFSEKYASENCFNVRDPEQWYLQSLQNIMAAKGASKVISFHNNSVPQALVDLFPDIGLDLVRFRVHPRWGDEKNRKAFFIEYANNHGFDPLIASNWYQQSRASIMATKGATRVIHYHNHSIPQALIDLFPEVQLQKLKFWITRMELENKEVRRVFFENYAKDNNFDPLIAQNWYNQPKDKILQKKGAARVLIHHNNSLSQALCGLFPEVDWQKKKKKVL